MIRVPEVALALAIAAAGAGAGRAEAEAPFAAVLPAPARGGGVSVSAEPGRILLGEDGEARIEVAVPADAIRVRLFASAGTIAEASLENPTRFVARYLPPGGFVPRVDVVVAVVETPGGTKVGFAALQLVGQGDALIRTRPNANARITIGDRLYGPVQADRAGEARIRVQVPPGTKVGTDEHGGVVDLGVPPMPRVALALPMAEIDMEEPRTVPVYAVLTTSSGGPDVDRRVSFVTNQGGMSEAKALGGGVFVAAYTPPVDGAGEVIVMAAVEGEPLPAATAQIELRPAAPELRAGGEARAAPSTALAIPPAPAARHGADGALKVGLAWNLGAMTTFALALDAAFEARLRSVGLRVGLELGFSESEARDRAALGGGATASVSSEMWLAPAALHWGARLPIAREWSLALRNETGVMLVDNSIRVGSGDAIRERAWLPAFGGALGISREAGPGALLVELRFLYAHGDLETLDGRLTMMYVTVGYRLPGRRP